MQLPFCRASCAQQLVNFFYLLVIQFYFFQSMLIVMVTADYLIAFILYILRRSKLLILRYLCVSKVAQGPFYSINFSSYNLHLLLLFNLPLDPFLQSREGPGEELLSYLYIVLVFLYQAELC